MSDAIKVSCPQCSAKYRLPAEAQGRSARCKVCGTKFAVASPKSLDDSVLDWLTDQNDQEEEDLVAQPRVINMPKGSGGKRRGPIRMKESADSATPEGE